MKKLGVNMNSLSLDDYITVTGRPFDRDYQLTDYESQWQVIYPVLGEVVTEITTGTLPMLPECKKEVEKLDEAGELCTRALYRFVNIVMDITEVSAIHSGLASFAEQHLCSFCKEYLKLVFFQMEDLLNEDVDIH